MAFFDQIGKIAYPKKWVPVERLSIRDTPNANNRLKHAMQSRVFEQLSIAFESGLIKALFDVVLPSNRDRQSLSNEENRDKTGDEASSDEGDPFEDDDSLTDPFRETKRRFIIDEEFWFSSWDRCITNLGQSSVRVPTENILTGFFNIYAPDVPKLTGLRAARSDVSQTHLTGPVLVMAAERALRNIVQLPAFAPGFYDRRYDAFPNRVIDELTIVAWRRLASTRRDDSEITPKFFFKIMKRYLIEQGINQKEHKISDKSLEVICRNIDDQYHSRDLKGNPLVNSVNAPFKTNLGR